MMASGANRGWGAPPAGPGLIGGVIVGLTTAKAIALVGLFNVIGCLSVGWLGMRFSKKWLLSAIYVGRSIAMALFLLLPEHAVVCDRTAPCPLLS